MGTLRRYMSRERSWAHCLKSRKKQWILNISIYLLFTSMLRCTASPATAGIRSMKKPFLMTNSVPSQSLLKALPIHIDLLCFTGVPSELVDDSKFVPLNAEDPRYGPPVSSG